MSTGEILPIAPPAAPELSLSAETGGLAEAAIGGIEKSVVTLGLIAIGIGIGIYLFKKGIKAIFSP